MSDSTSEDRSQRRAVVGVYRSEEQAETLVRYVRELGISEADIAVDDPRGDTESIVSEMQEEVTESYTMPQAGVAYSKEATRSMVTLGVPITIACTLLALPLALIDIGDLPIWVRLLTCGIIGAVAGGTIAIVVGPTLGAKRANEPLAAQRGTSVRVAGYSPELVELMAAADPIRLDVIDQHGASLGHPVATEDLSAGTGILDEINRNESDPLHENDPAWSSGEEQDRRS